MCYKLVYFNCVFFSPCILFFDLFRVCLRGKRDLLSCDTYIDGRYIEIDFHAIWFADQLPVVQRDRLHVDHAGGPGGELCDRCAKSRRRRSGLPESADRGHVPHTDEATCLRECPGHRELRPRAGGREAAASGRVQESEVRERGRDHRWRSHLVECRRRACEGVVQFSKNFTGWFFRWSKRQVVRQTVHPRRFATTGGVKSRRRRNLTDITETLRKRKRKKRVLIGLTSRFGFEWNKLFYRNSTHSFFLPAL